MLSVKRLSSSLLSALILALACEAGAWQSDWQPEPANEGRNPAEQGRVLWYVPAFRGARVYAGPSLDKIEQISDWSGRGVPDAVFHFPSGRYWPYADLVKEARSDTKPAFGTELGPHNAFVVMSGGLILGFVPEDYMALRLRLDKPARFSDKGVMLVSKEATAISLNGSEADVIGLMKLAPKR